MSYKLICGDALETLKTLPEKSVHCVVTSPPYWGLRDYGVPGQIGLEPTPEEYVNRLVEIFREVRRVLRDDGTVWLNLGDSYYNNPGGGSKTMTTGNKKAVQMLGRQNRAIKHPELKVKDLVGIPWTVAFALRADGWYLRSDIIWKKPNAMPESVRDRPTKAHEYIFLLTKTSRYFYDSEAIKEPIAESSNDRYKYHRHGKNNKAKERCEYAVSGGDYSEQEKSSKKRNKRTVWTVSTKPFKGAHFAVFPPDLIEPCILAGSRTEDTVLDPFVGSGTTGIVALKHNRRFIGIDLNPEYIAMSKQRIDGVVE